MRGFGRVAPLRRLSLEHMMRQLGQALDDRKWFCASLRQAPMDLDWTQGNRAIQAVYAPLQKATFKL